MGVEYKKEFFDRTYTTREAYGRVWKYARKYRFRIFAGILCGMLTAGTLLPLFQVIQPALDRVSQNERALLAESDEATPSTAAAPAELAPEKTAAPAAAPAPKNSLEQKIADNSRLPSWYPKVEKLARKCGIELQDESGAMGGALLLIALLVIPTVALLRLGLVFLNQYLLTWSASHVVADIREDLLDKIQRQEIQFHGRVDVGQLMSRTLYDPGTVQTIVQTMLAELARAPFEIMVSVGFIIWFAVANHMLPTLAIIVIGMPAFMIPVIALGRVIRRWTKRNLERGSVVIGRMHEVLTCIKVIKAYDAEDLEAAKFRQTNRTYLSTTLRAVRWGLLVGPVVETVGIILLCGFIVWCFMAHVTIANLVPMIAPLVLIYKPLKQMANLQVQVETAQAALQRIWSVLDLDSELPEKPDALRKTDFSDRIAFDNVSFRYETAQEDAVRSASFEIPRGKMIAVVGGTGSGKSTLSNLMARFFDPREGRVTMDGVDLRDLRLHNLRRLVGSVQQETILFNDTIEENIRYGTPKATKEEVIAAAKMANAHEFIMSQPDGYQRLCGEKGMALSGGERQRIAIARAILRNPPVLILDEATSALDTVTEHLVQEALQNLMKNRTVFAIAHRLSTIRDADLILVMDHGAIVERGTHDELYAAGGVYRRLCDMQHQS